VTLADTLWRRLRGLSGRSGLAEGEGLMLVPCRAVHMFGMRFPIDVAFLDRDGTVVATYPSLGPGARTRYHREARSALELPAGTLDATGTRAGDTLHWSAEEAP
ncbi:MAG TPA: DUF192 domain-containing protein, partial [Gemmatimonadales bacterium]